MMAANRRPLREKAVLSTLHKSVYSLSIYFFTHKQRAVLMTAFCCFQLNVFMLYVKLNYLLLAKQAKRRSILKDSTKATLKTAIKIAVVATLLIVIILNYNTLKNIDVRQIVASAASQTAAILSIIGVYILKGLVFVIPASLIYVSVGMAFTPFTAVLVNLAGITAEIIVSYIFGLFLGGDYVTKLLSKNEKSKKLLEMKDNRKQSSIFLIRLLPVFPIDFASLFFGSMKYPFIKYVFFSFLGLAPRVILFTVLGDTIYDYIPMELIIKAIICLIPIAIAAIIVRTIYKRKKTNDKKSD